MKLSLRLSDLRGIHGGFLPIPVPKLCPVTVSYDFELGKDILILELEGFLTHVGEERRDF